MPDRKGNANTARADGPAILRWSSVWCLAARLPEAGLPWRHWLRLIALTLAGPFAHGALQAQTLSEALLYSGTVPFQTEAASATNCSASTPVPAPGDDCSGSDAYVRTHDTAAYNLSINANGSPLTHGYLTLTMGATTLPGSYTGPANPTIALFSAAALPSGTGGCLNIQSTAMAGPVLGQSGVSADGQTAYCAIAGSGTDQSFSAITAAFVYAVTGAAPNGATIAPPSLSFTSDQNITALTYSGVLNVSATNPILKVSAAPRWDVAKTTPWWTGPLFISGSGPQGQDGYVFSYNIGVKALGSRVGVEALDSNTGITFTDDFSNAVNSSSTITSAQLVTWKISQPSTATAINLGAGNCGNWSGVQAELGNVFDNTIWAPTDYGRLYTGGGTNFVRNGGDCQSTSVGPTSANFTITGTDFSLTAYPTSLPNGRVLVNTAAPNASTNEWWVASKLILVWVPLSDVPPDTTQFFTNTLTTISATSVSGLANVQPLISDKSVKGGATQRAFGNLSKSAAPFYYTFLNGYSTPGCDPNVRGDCQLNQIAPGQLLSAYIVSNSQGNTVTLPTAYVCDQIDNARTTFYDATGSAYNNRSNPVTSPGLNPTSFYKDPATGIGYTYYSGTTVTAPLSFALGIGSTGAASGTWDSYNSVTSPYSTPSTSGSTNATGSCTDTSIQWFPSVSALTAANHSLSEINWVRQTYVGGMAPNTYVSTYVPLQANSTFSYGTSINAPASGAIASGSSIMGRSNVADQMTVNTVHFHYTTPDGALHTRVVADAVQFVQTEYATLSKSSSNYLDGGNVSAGSVVTFDLQVNLTSTTSTHATTVTVWDVLPQYMGYVAGSTTFGGATIVDPVCAVGSWPVAASGAAPPQGTLDANSTACVWTLENQTALFAGAIGTGDANLPLLQYKAGVSLTAPSQVSLLNTAFATSTNNEFTSPVYSGAASGFTCGTGAPCYFGNWTLNVSTPVGALLQKSVSTAQVNTNTGFSYSLTFGGLGEALDNVHLIDILPATGTASANGTTSSYAGTLGLASPVAVPTVSCSICTPPITQDGAMKVLYTSAAPHTISIDGNDGTQDYSDTGNGSGSTHWCSYNSITANTPPPGCPSSLAAVTAIAFQPLAGATLPRDTLYQATVSVLPAANAVGNTYVNNFSLASTTIAGSPLTSNNVTTTVVAPDPAVVKTASPTTVQTGSVVTYTLNVTNAKGTNSGPLLAGKVRVVDPLPTGFTMSLPLTATGWDCSASTASKVDCTYTGGYPIGEGGAIGAPLIVTAAVDLGTQNVASIDNTATLSFTDGGQPASQLSKANDTSKATVTVLPQVTLTKTSNVGATTLMPPGGKVTYTLTLRNSGNVAASVAVPFTLEDPLPTGVASTTWSCASSSVNSACPHTAGSGAINESVTSLRPGDYLTYTVVATLSNKPASGTITNSAKVDIPAGGNCGPSGSSAPCTASVSNVAAQLGSYKQLTAGPTDNGDGSFTVSYKVGALNYTPTDIAGFNITDPLATTAGGAFGSYSSTALSTAASYTLLNGGVTSCTLLQGTSSASYTPNAAFTGEAGTDALLNPATVLPGASTSGTPGQVECSITLSFAPAVGQTSYSNQATAAGYVQINSTQVPLSDLSYNGTDPKGGSPTLAPTAPENNKPTLINISNSVTPTIDKKVQPGSFVKGATTPVVYTVTVGNTGLTGAKGFAVTDASTGNFSITSWSCQVGNAGSSYVGVTTACADPSGTGDLNTTANLAPSGSVVYTIHATINASATVNQVNTAKVTPPAGLSSTVPSASSSATVTASEVVPLVRKTASLASYTPGVSTSLTYTIVASNGGSAGANGFSIVDTPPPGVTIGSWTCAVTALGTGTTSGVTTACAVGSGSGALSTTANLQAGGAVTYTVNAEVQAKAKGTQTNQVSLSNPDGVGPATVYASASIAPSGEVSQIPSLRQWALLLLSALLVWLALAELQARAQRRRP